MKAEDIFNKPLTRKQKAQLERLKKMSDSEIDHAEGYPAGERKHGPNALTDERLPVVILAPRDPADEEAQVLYEKTLSNIQEVKARQGKAVAVVTAGDAQAARFADHLIEIPPASHLLTPVLEVVPLQMLAYHIAVLRGCDVDQSRNLAKSVTVEWQIRFYSCTGQRLAAVHRTLPPGVQKGS